MTKIYFTIAGTSHHYGTEFLEPNMEVNLTKDPDNEYDKEWLRSCMCCHRAYCVS